VGGNAGGSTSPDIAIDALGADRRLAGIARQHVRLGRLPHDSAEETIEASLDMGDQDHAGIVELDQMGDSQTECISGPMQDADGGRVAERGLVFQIVKGTAGKAFRFRHFLDCLHRGDGIEAAALAAPAGRAIGFDGAMGNLAGAAMIAAPSAAGARSYYSYGYSYPSYGYGYNAYPAYGYGYNSYPSYGYSYPSYGYGSPYYGSRYNGYYGNSYYGNSNAGGAIAGALIGAVIGSAITSGHHHRHHHHRYYRRYR